MKYSLKVAEFHLKPGSLEEMLYTNDKEELFIGPARGVVVGETYQVEVRTKRLGGSYHRIISWLDEKT